MTPKVILYLRLAGQTGRNRLQGVFAYLKDKRLNWDIRLPQTEEQFFDEVADGADGAIVASYHSQKAIRWAERAKCPVVFIDIPKEARRKRRAVDITVSNDNGGFGLLAAQHFISIGGFASFGYVHATDKAPWNARRERGFLTGLRRQSAPVSSFGGDSQDELAGWLAGLPKPAAVYASWDERARDVLRACKAARIRVPEQVVLLGTDDDEIVCTLSSPEISSIRPDTEGEGYQAARWLHRQFLGAGQRMPRTVLCKAVQVVDRMSTKPPPPGKHLVNEALAYMKREHGLGITPAAIAAHFRCSRRILDMRFAEFHSQTVGEALTRVRLDHVCELLRKTGLPISSIGPVCGFANDNTLKNLFKRTFGMSMRDYRR